MRKFKEIRKAVDAAISQNNAVVDEQRVAMNEAVELAAAARAEAEAREKAAKKQQEAAEKEAAARQRAIEKAQQEELKQQISSVKDEKRDAERTLSETQRQLEGVIARPAQSPTDALTRMGAGNGYTAYNNATANVQVKIESHLRKLADTQQKQLAEISSKLDKLEDIAAGASTWQQD